MTQPSYQGRFLWQELHSNDPDAAAAFYGKLLSWKTAPFAPGSPYLLFLGPRGDAVGGVTRLSDEARSRGTPAHWLGYIGAADVDATIAEASRLGARVVQPASDNPGVGRTAVLADPQGAVFGVYRPLTPAAPGTPAEGGFGWFELAARERETALAFYQRLFGWELRPPMDMGGGMHYQTFGLGGEDFGGAYAIPAERPMPPSWLPYGHHRSADEASRVAVAAGARLAHGPADVPGGRIVQLFDTEGVMFAVHSATAAMQPATAPKASSAAARKPAKKAVKKAVKKASPKAVRKTIRKTARKSAAKTAAKSARRPVARKAAGKVATRSARKSAGKSARKTARKTTRKKVARRSKARPVSRRGARRPARKK